jgi:hypothetical protein
MPLYGWVSWRPAPRFAPRYTGPFAWSRQAIRGQAARIAQRGGPGGACWGLPATCLPTAKERRPWRLPSSRPPHTGNVAGWADR